MNPYTAFSLLDTQWQRFVSGLLIVVVTLFHYGAPTAFAAGELVPRSISMGYALLLGLGTIVDKR